MISRWGRSKKLKHLARKTPRLGAVSSGGADPTGGLVYRVARKWLGCGIQKPGIGRDLLLPPGLIRQGGAPAGIESRHADDFADNGHHGQSELSTEDWPDGSGMAEKIARVAWIVKTIFQTET